MSDDDSSGKILTKVSDGSRSSSARRSRPKPTQNPVSSVAIPKNEKTQVYVQDIPTDYSGHELEDWIQKRVEKVLRRKIKDVKCYMKLSIAVIRLLNEEDKEYLVSDLQSMILDLATNISVKFINEIDLSSYIVVDRNTSKIPSAKNVALLYVQAYKTSELDACNSISLQFPNIYRISPNTLDELAKVANAPDFPIDNAFATVYPCADCSFFEDLPTNMTDDKLSSIVATQIDENQSVATSFYAKYDKETSSAVVLASKTNKKWLTQSFLPIDGRNFPKKIKLAYRVTVHPVAVDLVNLVLNHELFVDKTTKNTHNKDHLIVELHDIKSYEQCLRIGVLRVEKKIMYIDKHSVTSDPETVELDAANWYETEMHDIQPDIKSIMDNHQHPIFQYKWNADNWLQQMKKLDSEDPNSKKYNRDRHLLRVTVMLNTIGVLRKKKYTIDGQNVTLKLQRMQTIGYDHQAKLFQGNTISSAELKTPYPSTTIVVSNEDCLVLYEQLVNEGYRPLLLNMANKDSPGGGYRKGDGAQEENLFRRSDYYQSLDLDIADRDRSERLYCTSKGEIKRPISYAGFYPMPEFGAIYTSGITVFRGTELQGYPYLKDPLYNICSIAMAAYREPTLTIKNMLEKKFATNTRKKIENIFMIGHQHKHDCLLLSAFGCGAFKNPPEHIALLFKSVIYQYAGYFKKIYFAIIDDHNTGNKINPKGNFAPFHKKLHGLTVYPPKAIHVNGAVGPYRILNKLPDEKVTLSNACIQHLPPCHHGTECRDIKNAAHNAEFSHPPVCLHQHPNSTCDQTDDDVHMFTFFHRIKCKLGGRCPDMNANHLNDFDHPEFCQNKSDCMDVSSEHLLAYRHLPLCPNGVTCLEYRKNKPEHISTYRHCRTICPDDNCCPNFHDKEHIKNTIHSFQKPCPLTPYNCSLFNQYILVGEKKVSSDVEQHCFTYSHVCIYGRLCKTKTETHYATSIHIARKPCPDYDTCSRINDENHLQSFSHPGIRDIRLYCRNPGFQCPDRFEEKHLKMYRHGKNFNHLTVALSKNLNASIDFYQNQGRMIRTVNDYVETSNWKKAKISENILDWIRALQPVHRCKPDVFASILVHGYVMSRDYMSELIKPRCVVNAVMQHNQIRAIFRQHNNAQSVIKTTKDLIKLLVKGEFLKAGSAEVPMLDSDHDHQINILQQKLKPSLSQHDFQVIYDRTAKIVVASIELSTHLAGIGFDVDKIFGTDKHVFSILGPHCGTYYGDIVITFKQELMFHPDANFSYQAATSFQTGRIYAFRPWHIDPSTPEKRVEDFHHAKLHCSYPRYEYAAAAELVACTGKTKQTMDVDLNDIMRQWTQVDSHFVFEGHLPPLIPLDYIENVYMPKNLFESLSKETQTAAQNIFKDSLILANYDVDLSLIKPGATVPLDSTRKSYLRFITEQLSEKIDERIQTPQLSRGFVITIPATTFDSHTVLPMTIARSYNLYCLNASKPPTHIESTYIYWQAMNGDMMLSITNEKIDPTGKEQPNLQCLICYVAEKPSTTTSEDYREEYSYLNTGAPYRHSNNVQTKNFKAQSNRFYRGCNTEDFFTYCLKIMYKTGEVSLSHAGPNGIYNRENIHCRFNISEIDLLKLNHIHISAGNQDVPIRNLTINHEPVVSLHPTIDEDFKLDTSGLTKRQPPSFRHVIDCSKEVEDIQHHDTTRDTPRKRSSSVAISRSKEVDPSPPAPDKRNFFQRLKYVFLGPTKQDDEPVSKASSTKPPTDKKKKSDAEPYHQEQYNATPHNPSESDSFAPKPLKPSPSVLKPPVTKLIPLISSTFPPCQDSIYCLYQNSREHTDKYSHPCRYNETCLRQASEPHLTHKPHDVPMCLQDKGCSELSDPIHRAEYRHSGLPDYLIPCHYQNSCNKKTPEHNMRYFHGEEIPSIKKINKPTGPYIGTGASKAKLIPCKFGDNCHDKKILAHTARFSHPST